MQLTRAYILKKEILKISIKMTKMGVKKTKIETFISFLIQSFDIKNIDTI